jgi:hypothetical protein
MTNKRRLIRLNVGDFIEIRSLNEVGRIYSGKSKDFTLMGICFSSEVEWKKGQVLFIDYFIPEELDSVRMKMVVVWSEFIDPENGYFCGGEIIEVEQAKQDKFANYYYKRLKGKLL